MEVALAMLRGINVSGQKMIKMPELKALLAEAGLKNITTYIQSGNIVFQSPHVLPTELPALIAGKIKERYHFEVQVITRTRAEIETIIHDNPLLPGENPDPEKLHVTFLAEEPAPGQVTKIMAASYAPDICKVLGKEVYLYCPTGYGKTKLTNTFFEKNLKVTATTRNWRTVNELYRILKTYEAAA